MQRADLAGMLYPEQPFVYALPAESLQEQWDSEEPVLVQGIIDGFFEEDGEIVLVDYKTDYLDRDGEQTLWERYGIQMQYYRRALEDMMQKPVKACVLYSIYLDKEIVRND